MERGVECHHPLDAGGPIPEGDRGHPEDQERGEKDPGTVVEVVAGQRVDLDDPP